VAILYTTHPEFLEHETGDWHPERPARLAAVSQGIEDAGVADALIPFEPVPAPHEAMARVHPGRYLTAIEELCVVGGGHIDADTVVSERSFEAARLAAGAGLEAVRRLDAGEGDTAFCAVRPPGHHATSDRPMGFCLVNNVSVVAASLVDRGERVLVVDYDAHHGNGTQDIFYEDPRVLYVSIHEYPLYPGTGSYHEMGMGMGAGTTVNIPVPAGTTGDVFRRAVDELVVPLAEGWGPTWLLVSAGFDAHRRDPITGLGLTSGDYADLATAMLGIVPKGRAVFFLEGGYDLEALAASVGSTLSALAGDRYRPEAPSAGGPGNVVVDAVKRLREQRGWM
jgi:acetoin utilization deacetylase AcuC-like enzyme